jgi:DNA-binding transcriptional MerR regulator
MGELFNVATLFENELVKNDLIERSSDIASIGSFMFIGELSDATGVDPKTIRYYEREKLLSPSRHGRFRVYVRSDLDRLNKILTMRRMGLPIARIRTLLHAEAGGLNKGKLASVLSNHLEVLRLRQSEVMSQLDATADALRLVTI